MKDPISMSDQGTSVRVSIIMPLYRRSTYIDRAARSVIGQEFSSWELLLVQDGADDDVRREALRLVSVDPRIRHLARNCVGSIGEACNFGMSAASGEYIAIIDDDDEWATPDKLGLQVEFLDGNPTHVGCGGAYSVRDAGGEIKGSYFKPESDRAIRFVALRANPVANSSAIFRKRVALDMGGYCTAIREFQDWDLWLRLLKRGAFYNFPKILMIYTVWSEGSSVRNIRGNASSALKIISWHRRDFPGYFRALPLYIGYWCFSRLPPRIVGGLHHWLSRMKKRLYGHRSHTSPR